MSDDPRGKDPRWLTRGLVEAIHDAQLSRHGGLSGLRDARALESALGRSMHRWHYQEAPDLADCAASYGYGLAKNHAFADANKRTAFVAMVTFFEWNGFRLTATEEAVVELMVNVADDSVTEAAVAVWLRDNSSRVRRKRAPKK